TCIISTHRCRENTDLCDLYPPAQSPKAVLQGDSATSYPSFVRRRCQETAAVSSIKHAVTMVGAKGGISIAITLLGALTLCTSHPLCYVDDRPTDPDEILEFCPEAQSGACCTDAEEALVQLRHEAVGNLTGDCDDLYKQVVCGVCGSYSGHLYERLGAELGVLDGMTMKNDFCEELVSACNEQITFPTYDGGDDYCTKHTGGGDDQFWSYPYNESDIFASGLTQVFDSQDDFPLSTIGLYQTPDSSMYWLVGQAGEIKMVELDDLSLTTVVVDISSGLSSGELYVDYEE
ncbi:unnamed protein product, partial [Ectocarpus sp. 4 AP-2014]